MRNWLLGLGQLRSVESSLKLPSMKVGSPNDRARLQRVCEEALSNDPRVGRNIQLSLKIADFVTVDVAVGEQAHHPNVTRDTLHRSWCASSKPLLAVAWALVAADSGTDVDAPLGAILDMPIDVTMLDLLSHRYVYSSPNMYEVCTSPVALRRPMVVQRCLADTKRVDSFSEYANHCLVAMAIESLAGQLIADFVQQRLIEPASLEGQIVVEVGPHNIDNVRARLGRLVWPLGVLSHSVRDFDWDIMDDPSLACPLTTCGGLVGFYRRFAREGWESALPWPELRERLLACRGGDALATYAPAFMTRLSVHGFGFAPSARAYGYVGAFGGTWALHDPDLDLSLAFHANGAACPAPVVEQVRQAVVSEAYACVTE